MGITRKTHKATYSYDYEQAKTLIPKEVKTAFSNRCKKEGTSESEVLRTAIHDFLNGKPVDIKGRR